LLDEIAAVIPPEVADLRPEDLRVEAEFFESLTREPTPTARSEPFPFPAMPIDSPEPPNFPSPGVAIAESQESGPGLALESSAGTREILDKPPPIPAPQAGLGIPPIEIEPPTILPPGVEIRRVREVVLPASVVLAWSLFVLAAVAMSFLAGLMIGHFLWKGIP
jgi:hypothetical protein